MKHKRNLNNIYHLRSPQGTMLDSKEDIEKELNHFLKNLLEESMEDRSEAISKIKKNFHKVITPTQNYNFLNPITMQEVESIIQETPSGKYLNSYGFTIGFVKSYQSMVKEYI